MSVKAFMQQPFYSYSGEKMDGKEDFQAGERITMTSQNTV